MTEQIPFKLIQRELPESLFNFSTKSVIEELSKSMSAYIVKNLKEKPEEYAWTYTNGHCIYCGIPLYITPEQDHSKHLNNQPVYDYLIPANRGGLFLLGNIAVACSDCATDKKDLLATEYYQLRINRNLHTYFTDEHESLTNLQKYMLPYFDFGSKLIKTLSLYDYDSSYKEQDVFNSKQYTFNKQLAKNKKLDWTLNADINAYVSQFMQPFLSTPTEELILQSLMHLYTSARHDYTSHFHEHIRDTNFKFWESILHSLESQIDNIENDLIYIMNSFNNNFNGKINTINHDSLLAWRYYLVDTNSNRLQILNCVFNKLNINNIPSLSLLNAIELVNPYSKIGKHLLELVPDNFKESYSNQNLYSPAIPSIPYEHTWDYFTNINSNAFKSEKVVNDENISMHTLKDYRIGMNNLKKRYEQTINSKIKKTDLFPSFSHNQDTIEIWGEVVLKALQDDKRNINDNHNRLTRGIHFFMRHI